MAKKADLNKFQCIGRLGKDAELRVTPNGKSVATMSVAVDRGGENGTLWLRVIAWDKLADICGQYLRKGQQVYMEGALDIKEYEKDGQKRYSTEVTLREMQMLGGAKEGESSNGHPVSSLDATVEPEDIPF